MDLPIIGTGLDMITWMDNIGYQRQKTEEELRAQLDAYVYEADFGMPEPKPAVTDMMLDDNCSYTMEDYEQYVENLEFNSTSITGPHTATQPTKKIKPIKIPGLVLKTPIAYEKDTDLSVIPIKKDGMGVCETCGAIGVKHAFYTKLRRFCSQSCSRKFNDSLKPVIVMEPNVTIRERGPMSMDAELKAIKCQTLAMMDIDMFSGETLGEVVRIARPAERPTGYQWRDIIGNASFLAAPVTCFKHAPAVAIWKDINVGMKVEVENTDCDDYSELLLSDSFWVASVMCISGYWGLLRYIGFTDNGEKDFWVNLCSSVVKPVGWCALRGKPLIPPKSIEYKYTDWKTFLSCNLHGAQTLPSNYLSRVESSLESRFSVDMVVEVVDKNRISQVKVASIAAIVGKRLRVRYYDSEPDDNGFTCHEDSPLLHPVGWAKAVGAQLDAPPDYIKRCSRNQWRPLDATSKYFPERESQHGAKVEAELKAGMKLEAIDPLNLSSICVATVMQVLRNNYVMIRIDSYDQDSTNSDWFCYHTSSPCIFPAGFCNVNHIPLTPPKGFAADTFRWSDYLEQTGLTTAPLAIFHREMPNHGFTVNMRLEAADLMDPRLVCVGTVSRVVGRLLKVHFDGWEDEYDQWLDCESPDIYPVGWCDVVHHKLEGPRSKVPNIGTKGGAAAQGKPGRCLKRKFGRRPRRTKFSATVAVAAAAAAGKSEPAELPAAASARAENAPPDSSGPAPEPEMGQEPAGPDQALPDAPGSDAPPRERPATSYINSNGSSGKAIPRLVDASGGGRGELVPAEWNVFDVAQFLRVNDCAAYCDSFSKRKIDGKTLINLSKDQIIDLTGMKVGPSLKIFDLIQQLKIKVNPSAERQKTFKKLGS